MANEVLKHVFQDMHSNIATSFNPDSVMDVLLLKEVLGFDDYYKLRQVPVSRDRCQDMMSLLYISKHPQAFLYLRLALLDEYPWIVDKIDKQLPSPASQLQQLHLGQSSEGDGKLLLPEISFIQKYLNTLNLKRTHVKCTYDVTDVMILISALYF